MSDESIFKQYYSNPNFQDRYFTDRDRAVDVIIPVLNSNALFEVNLLSFYREIPINRLLIGDAGCSDDSIVVAKKYPRTVIIDQKKHVSQGYCIRELMEAVTTEHFIYLHADVYLPENWFDAMYSKKDKYDWFECRRRMTILFDYEEWRQFNAERAYSGSQFGKTGALKAILPNIEDDYLQRNEDIIFMELVKSMGGRYGKVSDTFHYHQIMQKKGEKEPEIGSVVINRKSDHAWEKKILDQQVRGIIKYTSPKPYLLNEVMSPLNDLINTGAVDMREFNDWVRINNPSWLPYISIRALLANRICSFIARIAGALRINLKKTKSIIKRS